MTPTDPVAGEERSRSALLLAMLDIDPSIDEDEFNRWYFEEHMPERLACPGFISARRFVAVEGSPRYLALYQIEGPEVVQTEEYRSLARSRTTGNSVENPKGSPRTFAMLEGFRNPKRNIFVKIEHGEAVHDEVSRFANPQPQASRRTTS
jgi:hypothetical protein